MRDTILRSTKTAPLLHLFNRNKAASVSFENDTLTVYTKSGRITHTVNADQIKEVHLQKLVPLNRLTVRTQLDQAITINGLYPSTSRSLYGQLWARVDELLNDKAAAKANALKPEIFFVRDSLTALLTPDRYIRRSQVIEMQEAVGQLAQKFDEITRQKLDSRRRGSSPVDGRRGQLRRIGKPTAITERVIPERRSSRSRGSHP